ncbi:MAG: FHA domain-containing protein [Magnetococcales bacterium]|nr:FHA domain-containing protein [Magnetococcales bacterium]
MASLLPGFTVMTDLPSSEAWGQRPGDRQLILRYLDREYHVHEDQREFRIGRAGTSDLLIQEACISRSHARIYWDGQAFFIEDRSTNGTFLLVGRPPRLLTLTGKTHRLVGSGLISLGARPGHSMRLEVQFLEALRERSAPSGRHSRLYRETG